MPTSRKSKRKRNKTQRKASRIEPVRNRAIVYKTDVNESCCNLRLWSHIIGNLLAMIIYPLLAFNPYVQLEGRTALWMAPWIRIDPSDKHCISLNSYVWVVAIFWYIHFIRRTFEVLWFQKFYRKGSFIDITGSIIFYGSVALLNGACNNVTVWFQHDWGCPSMPDITLGFTLFVIGQVGNHVHHAHLEDLRQKYIEKVDADFKGHVLPRGKMFEYVSCPHYMFEALTWFGWVFICQFSMGSISMFMLTVSNVFMKALGVHYEYVLRFKDLYPGRAAFIPYVY